MTDEGFSFILPPDHENEAYRSVNFQSEDIDFRLSDPILISDWIHLICNKEQSELVGLNVIFCSDAYLHQINVQYLNHDTFTDIITFPYADPPKIHGDIFISIDRVKDNAAGLNIPFSQELHRVIIHGVLHLCGYGDKTPKAKKLMTEKEDQALHLFSKP